LKNFLPRVNLHATFFLINKGKGWMSVLSDTQPFSTILISLAMP
jgi:hypothetical protein